MRRKAPVRCGVGEKPEVISPEVYLSLSKGEDSKGGEDFWAKAEALYYQALIAYIWYEAPEEEKNMTTLLEMLNASEVRKDDENFKNAVQPWSTRRCSTSCAIRPWKTAVR